LQFWQGGWVAAKTKSGKSGLSGAKMRLHAAIVAHVALPLWVYKVAKVVRTLHFLDDLRKRLADPEVAFTVSRIATPATLGYDFTPRE
jgi:hypothetical protein